MVCFAINFQPNCVDLLMVIIRVTSGTKKVSIFEEIITITGLNQRKGRKLHISFTMTKK